MFAAKESFKMPTRLSVLLPSVPETVSQFYKSAGCHAERQRSICL